MDIKTYEELKMLDVQQQLDYIQVSGLSIAKLADALGTKKSTLSTHIKKLKADTTEATTTTTKPATDITTDNATSTTKPTTKITTEDYITLIRRIETLENRRKHLEKRADVVLEHNQFYRSQIDKLNDRIEKLENKTITTTTTVATNGYIEKFNSKNSDVRSMRIDKDILEAFDKYCKASDYSKNDVLSSALKHFMNITTEVTTSTTDEE